MSDLKVVDSHFHVWNLDTQSLPWLDGTDGTITHTYKVEDLEAEYARQAGVEFVGGVYVEVDCADHEAEDKIAYDLKAVHPKMLACMLRSDVSPWMRVPAFAAGIREPLHIDSEPKGRCLEPSFVEGLHTLAKKGLPFESCNRVNELEDAYEAFAQAPEETVILNHLGNVEALTPEWCAVMKKFATLPNLYVKVSGFPTADKQFVSELLKFTRDTFDPKKLLYASNWPVVKLYSSFDEHFQTLRDALGDDEDFFMNNAVRAYGLKF